jgi:hypothetical protein
MVRASYPKGMPEGINAIIYYNKKKEGQRFSNDGNSLRSSGAKHILFYNDEVDKSIIINYHKIW